jgi:hypothetical protein
MWTNLINMFNYIYLFNHYPGKYKAFRNVFITRGIGVFRNPASKVRGFYDPFVMLFLSHSAVSGVHGSMLKYFGIEKPPRSRIRGGLIGLG